MTEEARELKEKLAYYQRELRECQKDLAFVEQVGQDKDKAIDALIAELEKEKNEH